MVCGAHEKLMVLTFGKDEMATSTPSQLKNYTSDSYRSMRKRLLGTDLFPAAICSIMADGVEYGHVPAMLSE
jgi:hypothetical protein